jgi:predicted metal-binding protein
MPPGNVFTLKIKEIRLGRKTHLTYYLGKKGGGAEAIVFASCMSRGNPIGFACPHFAEIKSAVEKKLGAETKIIDWTH